VHWRPQTGTWIMLLRCCSDFSPLWSSLFFYFPPLLVSFSLTLLWVIWLACCMYGPKALKHEIPNKGYQRTNALSFQIQSRDHRYSEMTDGKHATWDAAVSKRGKLIGTWGRDRLARRARRIHVEYTCMGEEPAARDREKQNEQTRQT